MNSTPRPLVIEPETDTMVGTSHMNVPASIYQTSPSPYCTSASGVSFSHQSVDSISTNVNMGNQFRGPNAMSDMIANAYAQVPQIRQAMLPFAAPPTTFHNYNPHFLPNAIRPRSELHIPSSSANQPTIVRTTSTFNPVSFKTPLPVSLHKNVTLNTKQQKLGNNTSSSTTLRNISNNNSKEKSTPGASKLTQIAKKTRKSPPPISKSNVPWDAHLRAVTLTEQSVSNAPDQKDKRTGDVDEKSDTICNEMFIDNKKIPFVFRKMENDGNTVQMCLLPVTALEQELLSKYPKDPPQAIKNRPALKYFTATPEERHQLLTKLSLETGECRLVEFNAFMQFFEILKKCVKLSDKLPATKHLPIPEAVEPSTGWVQLDNSIVPYITRENRLHVPKCVIEFVCMGRQETLPSGVPCSLDEAVALNNACSGAGININFAAGLTLLVPLDFIEKLGLYIKFLPKENPIRHAQFLSSEDRSRNDGTILKETDTAANTAESCPRPSTSRKRELAGPSSSVSSTDTSVTDVPSKRQKPVLSEPLTSAMNIQSSVESATINPPKIEINEFKGKSLACLIRGSSSLVLLEAVVRVFFSFQSIEFIGYLLAEKGGYPLSSCTKEEETAFIKFYGIPTDKLQNNTLVDITVLSQHFDYLSPSVPASNSNEKNNSSKQPCTYTFKARKPESDDDDVIVLD